MSEIEIMQVRTRTDEVARQVRKAQLASDGRRATRAARARKAIGARREPGTRRRWRPILGLARKQAAMAATTTQRSAR